MTFEEEQRERQRKGKKFLGALLLIGIPAFVLFYFQPKSAPVVNEQEIEHQAELVKYHGIDSDDIKYNVIKYLVDRGAIPDNHTATVSVIGDPYLVDDYIWCKVYVDYTDSKLFKHQAVTTFYYYFNTKQIKCENDGA